MEEGARCGEVRGPAPGSVAWERPPPARPERGRQRSLWKPPGRVAAAGSSAQIHSQEAPWEHTQHSPFAREKPG